MNLTEFCNLLRELGLLSTIEGICLEHSATLAEVHGKNLMPHANRARVAVVRELRARTRWSWRRLGQVLDREGTSLCRSVRAFSARKDVARHVVKFGDGQYLGLSLRYEDREPMQGMAHRWLTWSSAKMIADSIGQGARAVKLVKRIG